MDGNDPPSHRTVSRAGLGNCSSSLPSSFFESSYCITLDIIMGNARWKTLVCLFYFEVTQKRNCTMS